MVNQESFLQFILNAFQNELGENLLLLSACGSLGRGNFLPGWSDADLLLIVKEVSFLELQKINRISEAIEKKYNIDIDAFTISNENLNSVQRMHGKLINYLFFVNSINVLCGDRSILPVVTYKEYKDTLYPSIIEYQKSIRQAHKMSYQTIASMHARYKKNIKLTFLILKRYVATESDQPETYDYIVKACSKYSWLDASKLLKYAAIRNQNLLPVMNAQELEEGISDSFNYFEHITNYLLTI
jgi:hypothetical protein